MEKNSAEKQSFGITSNASYISTISETVNQGVSLTPPPVFQLQKKDKEDEDSSILDSNPPITAPAEPPETNSELLAGENITYQYSHLSVDGTTVFDYNWINKVRNKIKSIVIDPFKEFLSSSSQLDEAKVQKIGKVSVFIARTEYFLNSILGVHNKSEWSATTDNEMETDGKNKGDSIKFYFTTTQNTYANNAPWCSTFAISNLERAADLTSSNNTASGYKISNDRFSHDTSKGGFSISKEEFKEYKNIHDKVDGLSEKEKALKEKIKNIQSGDILVLRTKSYGYKKKDGGDKFEKVYAPDNDFLVAPFSTKDENSSPKKNSSHTVLVEEFKNPNIYTIGGNEGDGIGGKIFDISKDEDVKQFIFLSRPDISNYNITSSNNNTTSNGTQSIQENEEDSAPLQSTESNNTSTVDWDQISSDMNKIQNDLHNILRYRLKEQLTNEATDYIYNYRHKSSDR